MFVTCLSAFAGPVLIMIFVAFLITFIMELRSPNEALISGTFEVNLDCLESSLGQFI